MLKTMRAKLTTDAPKRLDAASMEEGLRYLSGRDADLARIYRELGPPQMWAREPGFATLVLIILEQQVSLASAKAVFERLSALASPLTPERFLRLDDATLKGAGFSRQKIAYCRNVAALVEAGGLDLDALNGADDGAVRSELLKLKGVGPWTAEIYLLRALGRPDAWPSGDLALLIAAHEVKRLDKRPTPLELEALAEPWRPWRAVAARLLWQYYLHKPARTDAARTASAS